VTALQTEIRLIVGRLEDFAAKIDTGLEDSDWLSKREMIRALVKRVEVTPDRVNVVFRVDAYPGEASPEKKSLQLRRGSDQSVAVLCGAQSYVALRGENGLITRFARDEHHITIGSTVHTRTRSRGDLLPKAP
jgi:hypothetical protein